MKKHVPAWAVKKAAPDDLGVVRDLHRRGRLSMTWPERKTLRDWARDHAWPTPRFGFQKTFMTRMLENEGNFDLALRASGIEISIPRRDYTISAAKIGELDALYGSRTPGGYPDDWGILVEELREIRRAVEAGVVIQIEGERRIRSWQSFYDWAHGRYHGLEDGYDHWIGDDDS